jgi:hypothetical protein
VRLVEISTFARENLFPSLENVQIMSVFVSAGETSTTLDFYVTTLVYTLYKLLRVNYFIHNH